MKSNFFLILNFFISHSYTPITFLYDSKDARYNLYIEDNVVND